MKFQLIVISALLLVEIHGGPVAANGWSKDGRPFLDKFLERKSQNSNINFGHGFAGFGPGQGQARMSQPMKEKLMEKRVHKEKPLKVKVKPLDYGYITSLGPFMKMAFPKPNAGYYGGGYYVWNW